jgi:hypothetical protein
MQGTKANIVSSDSGKRVEKIARRARQPVEAVSMSTSPFSSLPMRRRN